MNVHPQSFRALAYELKNHLYNSGYTDDSLLGLPLIEQKLRHSYGGYLAQEDIARLKLGQEPRGDRLKDFDIPLEGEGMIRRVKIDMLVEYNGLPYTKSVGNVDELNPIYFTQCRTRSQLKGMSELTRKPCFALEATLLILRLLPQFAAMQTLRVVGLPLDPFPSQNRSDEWFWEQPWPVSEEIKKQISLDALSVLMNTHVRLAARADITPNGIENKS